MQHRVTITVAHGSDDPATHAAAIRAALAGSGIAARVQVWDGAPTGADYAAVWRPPAGLFAQERNLRAVFVLGAGVENALDLVPAHVPVLRMLDPQAPAHVAEYVCFTLARLTRGLHRFAPYPRNARNWRQLCAIGRGDRHARAAHPAGLLQRLVDGIGRAGTRRALADAGDAAAAAAEPPPERALGTPSRALQPAVGVAGLGHVGGAVARAARMFGYRTLGWSRTPKAASDIETFVGSDGLRSFLSQTEILVNALPLTAATTGLFDRETLAWLPRGAHLINVGRGATVVDADLLAALDSGHLASATLDVFADEPLPPAHPFWRHRAVTLTPHIAGVPSVATLAQGVAAAVAALATAGAAAHRLPGYVDRERGY
ncbi:MAG: hypothetical protein N2688_08845 [Burkholderiaceae bacterium]|nr:hypothetical protein [Burkholderiaceae bacterium]